MSETSARAKCAEPGTDPEAFFEIENATDEERPVDTVRVSWALATCNECPVRVECLRAALEQPIGTSGIWGGMTAEDWNALRPS